VFDPSATAFAKYVKAVGTPTSHLASWRTFKQSASKQTPACGKIRARDFKCFGKSSATATHITQASPLRSSLAQCHSQSFVWTRTVVCEPYPAVFWRSQNVSNSPLSCPTQLIACGGACCRANVLLTAECLIPGEQRNVYPFLLSLTSVRECRQIFAWSFAFGVFGFRGVLSGFVSESLICVHVSRVSIECARHLTASTQVNPVLSSWFRRPVSWFTTLNQLKKRIVCWARPHLFLVWSWAASFGNTKARHLPNRSWAMTLGRHLAWIRVAAAFAVSINTVTFLKLRVGLLPFDLGISC